MVAISVAKADRELPLTLYKEFHLTQGVSGLAWSPDSHEIAATYNLGLKASVWDISSGNVLQTFEGIGGTADSLSFLSDSNTLITAHAHGAPPPYEKPGWLPKGTGALSIWDIGRHEVLKDIPGPNPTGLPSVSAYRFVVSADSSLVAFSPVSGIYAAVYSLKDSKLLQIVNLPQKPPDNDLARCLALSPGGKYLAIGTVRNFVYVYDVTTGAEVNKLVVYPPTYAVGIGALAFSPDSQFLSAGAGLSATVRILPDGKREAIVPDHAVTIWRVTDGALTATYPPDNTHHIRFLSWSPDGRMVAIAAADHTVRLWSPAKSEDPGTVLKFSGSPMAVIVSPDGKYLGVTVGTDVKIFLMPPSH